MSDIKPIPVKSAYGRGGGRGGGKGGGRGGRGDRSNRSWSGQIQNQKSRPVAQKFKGNSSDLEGYIFDCSDSRQADKYITAIKRIAEYVGAEFKYGGDIRSSIENSKRFEIPMPTEPSENDTVLIKMVLNIKIDIYVKRDGILDENLQKAYSLIHGQCTELLKSKLKTSENWETVSSQYDMLGLLEGIKTIIYKFEDQKYLPLSLHHAKKNFYAFCQGNLPNPDYLDRFMNLVDMAESYDAKLYDQVMFKIAQDSTR